MRGKKELFMLITGLVLFIFDLVTDIVVAVQYRLKGEYWWFGLTLFFIIVPLLIVNIMAAYQTHDGSYKTLSLCSCCLCSSIFVRYGQEFEYWKRRYWDNPPCGHNYKECSCLHSEQHRAAKTLYNDSAYKLAQVCYAETLTESAPQWCLQVYIMLRQWDFPWLTVLSTVFSLLSLAWSITALEKARANKNSQNSHNFTLPATVVFFTSQLFHVLSRLFAIAAFAYVFKEHLFTALAVRLLMMYTCLAACMSMGSKYKCDDVVMLAVGCTIINFVFMLHVPNALLKTASSPRKQQFVIDSVISVQNVLFAILAVTIPTPDAKHMSVLRPLVLSLVIIGAVLGTIFYILYHKLFAPTEEPHQSDEENV
jgi:hypothetical protein